MNSYTFVLYYVFALSVFCFGCFPSFAGEEELEIVSFDVVRNAMSKQPKWQRALDESRGTFDEFIRVFNEPRGIAQSHFVVTFFARIEGQLRPFGIEVESIQENHLTGRLIANHLKPTLGEMADVPIDSIVDWRYLDAWELFGGKLLRTIYKDQPKVVQLHVWNYFCHITVLEPAPSDIPTDRELTQHIANSRSEKALEMIRRDPDKLFKVITSLHPPNAHEGMIQAYDGKLIEFCVEFGDLKLLNGIEELVSIPLDGDEPLFWAACNRGNVATAKRLLELGSDLEKKVYFHTPLFQAVMWNHTEMVAFLLARGADPNTTDSGNYRPIHYAKSLDVARLLIDHGAKVDVISESGYRPLDNALENGRKDIAKFLIANGHPVPKDLKEWLDRPPPEVRGREIVEALDAQKPELEQLYGKDYQEVDYGCILPIRELTLK